MANPLKQSILFQWQQRRLLSIAFGLIALSSYGNDRWDFCPTFKDLISDTIRFANPEIDSLVHFYLTPTITKRNGKQKVNKQFSADFADIIAELNNSEYTFTFVTDHASVLADAHTLGAFQAEKEPGHYLIAVPDHRFGTKADLMNRFGGRGALLAEETYHAYQLVQHPRNI